MACRHVLGLIVKTPCDYTLVILEMVEHVLFIFLDPTPLRRVIDSFYPRSLGPDAVMDAGNR